MGNPFVSVLIDTYNHERFVERAILSVLEQDFPESDREIIVVDDGSIDNTIGIIRKYQPKVRLLRKVNGGQASVFNAGIPECRGEIVAFLDGDDWWEPRKLSSVVTELQKHPDIGTIGHGIYEVDEFGHRLRVISPRNLEETRLRSEREGFQFLPQRSFLGTSRLTIRKNVALQVLPLPLELRIEADEFLATVTTSISGARILAESLTNYRLHSANMFQFTKFDPQKARIKHAALAAIANELPSRLSRVGISSEVTRILTRADHLDAERIRLSLGEGWPWETVRVEHEIYSRTHRQVSFGHAAFHIATLCIAGSLPPYLFYRISRSYWDNNLARFRFAKDTSQISTKYEEK